MFGWPNVPYGAGIKKTWRATQAGAPLGTLITGRSKNSTRLGYSSRDRALARASSRASRPSVASSSRNRYKGNGSGFSRNARTGGFLGIELKFKDETRLRTLDTGINWDGAESDPTGDCIGSVSSGSGESQRDGIKYTIKSIFITGTIRINYIIGQFQNPMVFLALVQDKATNGAQLNSENVYINPSASITTSCIPLRNLEYSHRFIVHDKVQLTFGDTTALWDGANVTSSGQLLPFTLSMNKLVMVHCTDSLAGVTSIEDNSFHLVAVATQTSPPCDLEYNVRTRFYAK